MMMLIMVVYSDQILACNLMDQMGWVRLVYLAHTRDAVSALGGRTAPPF